MRTPLSSPIPEIAAMLLSVATIGVIAFVDQERESAAALQDFAEEQATLAAGLAASLRLAVAPDKSPPLAGHRPTKEGSPALGTHLGDVLGSIDSRGVRVALLLEPGSSEFVSAGGQRVGSEPLLQGLAEGGSVVRLKPDQAVGFGLPRRTAMAGLARVGGDPDHRWSVAVVTTAERERDRDKRARWRPVLAVALATLLVLGFGGWALKRQRTTLELSRKLAVAEVERERDERLGQLNRAAVMMTFASGIAHELATPLAVIAGRAEQLQARLGGDERAVATLSTISEQAAHMRQVVRGFLELARGDSVPQETSSPETILRTVRMLVEHRFAKARVALGFQSVHAPKSVKCNPLLLEHALVNLLLNACDACQAGGQVNVEIAADRQEIGFVVTDDGSGIPADIAAQVAEPFFTTKPKDAGTGLGLAIVSEIAKAHHGTLSLVPIQPHGTRASLLIPA